MGEVWEPGESSIVRVNIARARAIALLKGSASVRSEPLGHRGRPQASPPHIHSTPAPTKITKSAIGRDSSFDTEI